MRRGGDGLLTRRQLFHTVCAAGVALTTVGSVAVFSRLLDGAGPASAAAAVPGSPDAASVPSPPATSVTVPTDGPPGPRADWAAVFSDEFDGTVVDATKWRSNRYGGSSRDGAFNPGMEGAYYSPDNVTVQDGQALLTILPDPRRVEGVDYTHSSGCLSTEGRFTALDGDYVEARIWVPSGDGLWPAFWSVPGDRWPPETDIAEFFDTSEPQPPTFIYHFPGPVGKAGPGSVLPYGDPDVDYRDSWHTYGLLRSAGRLVPYLDGVAYPTAGVRSGADDLPQHLVLNLAVYAQRTPLPGTQMRIDWVRVWRPV